ncbi:MAG: DUF6046 domain-containing protein [Flavipsychrobacter sp.]
MAEVSFSIAQLFEQQFGYKSEAFNFSKQVPDNTLAKRGTDLIDNDAFGREFFMPVWLGADTTSYVALPYPVVRIECRKTIVDTPLTERNGTVKELINTQDYRITIRGLIISADKQWPEDGIAMLNDLFKMQAPLFIKCALTDIFLLTPERGGSDKVVMISISFPESRGAKDIRAYEIELISDEIFSLNEI